MVLLLVNAITLHEHLSGRNCAQKLHPVNAFSCGKVFARCKRVWSRFERLEMIGPDRKQRKIRKRRVPIFYSALIVHSLKCFSFFLSLNFKSWHPMCGRSCSFSKQHHLWNGGRVPRACRR